MPHCASSFLLHQEGVPGPRRRPIAAAIGGAAPGQKKMESGRFDQDANSDELRRAAAHEGLRFYKTVAFWPVMATLTFRDPVGPDPAMARWRSLVRVLNESVFGSHYTQKVKHSYFSYLMGIEFQRRDVVHFHALISRPVDFGLIHRWWNKAAGFAWVSQVRDRVASLNYVTKYVLKGGEVLSYRSMKPLTMPSPLPWIVTDTASDPGAGP
jgi:hypothetical protein